MARTSSGREGAPRGEAPGTRLNRYLARAGVGSRRDCDELIERGLVKLNGRRAASPGERVLPGDRVEYGGRVIILPDPCTFAWNKPIGVETSLADRAGRLAALVDRLPAGCVPVGRLDMNTSGLLLLSNDGDLTHRLTHPRWGVEREYLLGLAADLPRGVLPFLRAGVAIAPGQFCRPVSVKALGARRLAVVLRTGRYHEVRRLADAARLEISFLERRRFGAVSLGDLARGAVRRLMPAEAAALYASVGLEPPHRRA